MAGPTAHSWAGGPVNPFKGQREAAIRWTLRICALTSVVGLVLMVAFLLRESLPAWKEAGLANIFAYEWNPDKGRYGILIFLAGTLAVSLVSLLLGAPLALATAIYLHAYARPAWRRVIGKGLEVLAGIPSIILGWLGFTTLVPLVRRLAGGTGMGILPASIVLAVMILPTVATIARDSLDAVPESFAEASFSMGATRWQTLRRVIIPTAWPGIAVAMILGLGRALGETMAVAMVIGPATAFPRNLTTPTHTLTTKIMLEMGESTGVHRSSLFAMALVLLALSMLLILLVRLLSRKAVREFSGGVLTC